jgi:hypothetical protein
MKPTPPGERGLTHTYRVYQALLNTQQDFMNVAQLVKATGSNFNQVSAALFSLRKFQAVDVVIENDGVGWWFATPETDLRSRHVQERRVEEPGHRRLRGGPRRGRAKVIQIKRSGEVE